MAGISNCRRNSFALLRGADILLRNGHFPAALSLAVLALEEIGKMMHIDSLVFAKAGDERDAAFQAAFRSHPKKLEAINGFPYFLAYLATFKPKWAEDNVYVQQLRSVEIAFREQLTNVMKLLGLRSLSDFDGWKQRGFYTSLNPNGVTEGPSDAIDDAKARPVVAFSGLVVESMDWIFELNFERYKAFVLQARGVVSDEKLLEIRRFLQDWLMIDAKNSNQT
ncbi:MAG TPA: AbiV family abortive infection protein [bacterium]|nr:AbiV family abortive infection protein [bacterium]